MKRPAEEQLSADKSSGTSGQPASAPANPFAGFSLTTSAPASTSLFTAADAAGTGVNPFAGISFSAPTPPAGSLFSAAAASNAASGGFAATSNAFSAASAGFGFSASSGASASGKATGDSKPNDNPFSGLSLFSSASGPSASGKAASDAKPNDNAFSGVSLFSSASGSSTFPKSTTTAPSDSSGSSNPFSGVSLFSTAAAAAPAAGGVFTAAAESLQQGKGEASTNVFAASGSPATSPAVEGNKGEAKSDQASAVKGAPGAASDAATDLSPSERSEQTGEEDEEVIFNGECKLWKLGKAGDDPKASAPTSSANSTSDGDAKKDWQWLERGCGIVHINIHRKTGKGRLVMRMRGVLKLLLNTPVFPTAKYELVGQKSVRFLGVDVDEASSVDGQVNMCAFRLNLQSNDQQSKFLKVMRDTLGVTTAT